MGLHHLGPRQTAFIVVLLFLGALLFANVLNGLVTLVLLVGALLLLSRRPAQ